MTEHKNIPSNVRAQRRGRPDGTSVRGQYVARWTDEDTGAHEAQVTAASEQDVRDLLEPYIASNTLKIHRVGT